METVGIPSPSLFAVTLRILGTSDSWDAQLGYRFDELTCNLDISEAGLLPRAIGGTLGLLRADVERLRVGAEFIVAFGLYEAAADLAEIALTSNDRQLLLQAASICAHPAVPSEVRQQIIDGVGHLPVALVRLDPNYERGNPKLERLRMRCWPGLVSGENARTLPPTVVFGPAVGVHRVQRLSARLNVLGCAIRRLASTGELPDWFGSRTIVVADSATIQKLDVRLNFPRNQAVVTDGEELDEKPSDALLRSVWERRPDDWKPHITDPDLIGGFESSRPPRSSIDEEFAKIVAGFDSPRAQAVRRRHSPSRDADVRQYKASAQAARALPSIEQGRASMRAIESHLLDIESALETYDEVVDAVKPKEVSTRAKVVASYELGDIA